jgi:hypothetical protein
MIVGGGMLHHIWLNSPLIACNTGTWNMTNEENLKVELDRLKSENEALKRTLSRGLSLKISEKGGLSVYGLGRFPVTLYKEQWIRLLDLADEIRTFIKANEKQLKAKEPPAAKTE